MCNYEKNSHKITKKSPYMLPKLILTLPPKKNVPLHLAYIRYTWYIIP